MINYTNIDDDDLIANSPFDANLDDAEVDGWTDDSNPNRMWGYTDLVAYWDESGRAAHVTNGDPVWYDATSIKDATEKAQSEEYE